jgi:septal ring factor EnvC (AmiA/AmiB activator)
MVAIRLSVVLALLLCIPTGSACAQTGATYRCIDGSGRSTYTNVKEEMTGRKCTLVSREVSVVPAQAPSARPTETSSKAKPAPSSRAADRRKILEEELGDEEKRLAEAKKQLADQQAIRTGDERNYQRVLDRLKPFEESVEQHEKNIAQLKRELSAAR